MWALRPSACPFEFPDCVQPQRSVVPTCRGGLDGRPSTIRATERWGLRAQNCKRDLWGLAVDGNHIGASGLIYGLAAFLFTSGVIRNNRLLLRVSLAVAFLYGGIVWWMLPIDDHVSWEGHLSGAVVGTLLAVAFKRQGPKAWSHSGKKATAKRARQWSGRSRTEIH